MYDVYSVKRVLHTQGWFICLKSIRTPILFFSLKLGIITKSTIKVWPNYQKKQVTLRITENILDATSILHFVLAFSWSFSKYYKESLHFVLHLGLFLIFRNFGGVVVKYLVISENSRGTKSLGQNVRQSILKGGFCIFQIRFRFSVNTSTLGLVFDSGFLYP